MHAQYARTHTYISTFTHIRIMCLHTDADGEVASVKLWRGRMGLSPDEHKAAVSAKGGAN
jgi:hypothetical protein